MESGTKALKSTFDGMLDSITEKLRSKATDAKTAATAFSKAYVTGAENALKPLPNVFTTAFKTMSAAAKAGIVSLQAMFAATKFSFSQSIALPHFSMSGSFNAQTRSVPYVNVSWYSKAMDSAMVLDSPTIFGAADGNLLGAGESGSEVVAGEQHLLSMMRDVVSAENAKDDGGVSDLRQQLADIKAALIQYLPALARMQMVLDTGTLVGEIAAPMDTALGQRSIRKGRETL